MADQTTLQLNSQIEKARKVLYYEQKSNYQDKIVKPDGLELFAVRWADEASLTCKSAGLDISPIYRFTEYLEGYRKQDPMQRAASLRAALAILNELDSNANGQSRNPIVSTPQSTIGGDKSSSPALPSTPPPGHDKLGLHDQRVKPGSPALSTAPAPGHERIETLSASSAHGPHDRGRASAAAPQNTVHVEAG